MDGIREYIFRLAAGGIIASFAIRLSRSSASAGVIRMLCGLFLTVILLEPLAKSDLLQMEFLFPQINAGEIAQQGMDTAENLRRQIIKQRAEEYISNRADKAGAQIEAEIFLREDGIPNAVKITGQISPLAREDLSRWICSELDIPKGRQEWIG